MWVSVLSGSGSISVGKDGTYQAHNMRQCPAGRPLPGVIHTDTVGVGGRRSACGCMLGDRELDRKQKTW